MPAESPARSRQANAPPPADTRLRKHADYQRVYREGRRQSLPLMTYFFAVRRFPDAVGPTKSENATGGSSTGLYLGPRVGLTAGRVLGNAVERNRIKRRMRQAIRRKQMELTCGVDVVLHPRRSVLEAEFSQIEREVLRAFRAVQAAVAQARTTDSGHGD